MQEIDLLGVRGDARQRTHGVAESATGRSRPYRPDLHRGAEGRRSPWPSTGSRHPADDPRSDSRHARVVVGRCRSHHRRLARQDLLRRTPSDHRRHTHGRVVPAIDTVAVRTGTPIYVSDAVIAEVGFVDGAEPESDDQPEEMVEVEVLGVSPKTSRTDRDDLRESSRGPREDSRRSLTSRVAHRTIHFVTST